ncbi:MAG: fumarate hydratase C-terminal domain-containing protein, partial [Acidobacteriota bacterium]
MILEILRQSLARVESLLELGVGDVAGHDDRARDIAHAKLKERLDAGEDLPQYFKDHAVYYAGPAKTPDGEISGS